MGAQSKNTAAADEKQSVVLLAALAAAASPEAVKEVAEKALKALAAKETEVDQAVDLFNEQAAELDKQRKADPKYRPEVKVGKQLVRIEHGVNLGGGKILSVEALANDTKIIGELLKSGSSAVKVVGEA